MAELESRSIDLTLYLVTDSAAAAGRSMETIVADALDGGVTVVQVRDKALPAGDLADLCRRLLPLTRGAKVPLIVNDRVDVARAVGADGVHLGGGDLPLAEARRVLGQGAVIGGTAASEAMARAAAAAGADYLGVGPFRATPTKTGHATPLGEEGLARIVRSVELPVVAIGGLEAADAGSVVRAGARGMAVARAVCAAEEPGRAAAELRAALDGAGEQR